MDDEISGALSLVYDFRRDKYFVIENDGVRMYIPVDRRSGFFDAEGNYVQGEVIGV